MNNSDDAPLSEFLINLGLVRGALGSARDARFMRGRIALIAMYLGTAIVLLLAMRTKSWIVGVVGMTLLLVGLWLFAARSGQAAALARRENNFDMTPGPSPGRQGRLLAQQEADLPAVGKPQEQDPAGDRAERNTNRVLIIIGLVAAVGGVWVVDGTTASVVAAGIAGLIVVTLVVRWRTPRP